MNEKKDCFLEREWSDIPDTRWSDDEEHSVRHSKGRVTHSALPQNAQFQSILCNDSCNLSWNINPPRTYTFNGPEEQMILS